MIALPNFQPFQPAPQDQPVYTPPAPVAVPQASAAPAPPQQGMVLKPGESGNEANDWMYPGESAPSYSGGGSSYQGTSVFDDPATKQWEALLNQRVQQLQTPYQNPGFQPAIDQLNQYLARLNGPAYTPQEMDLIQTQAIDPIEQQRQAAKQQVITRMAAHGISASSGILEKALQDVDRQFDALHTKTKAGFAVNATQLDRENAQLASQLAPQIANMYQSQFNAQDLRNQQAVNLAGQIPETAWGRLTGANQLIQPTSPLAALQGLQNFQTQGYNQGADFSNGLMQLLALLFGG